MIEFFDQATGTLVLPLWAAAALAVLLIALAVIAVARVGAIRTVFALAGIAVAAYAIWAGSVFLDRIAANDRIAERRAFEQRAQDLIARAAQPGSPLACLDDTAGEQVAQACESVLFGSPETTAAAASHVQARLSLLIEGLDAASRSDDPAYETTLNALRRGLETDRFGLVAHVLLQQGNCFPDQCEALAVLRNPNKVRANLQDKTFDTLVTRNAAHWQKDGGALAETGKPGNGSGPATASVPTGIPVSPKYDFPSADSIPPVSIMNAEPAPRESAPRPATSAAAPAASVPTPAPREPRPSREARSPREAREPAPRRPAATRQQAPRSEAPAPVQLAPSAAVAPPANGTAPPAGQ